MNRSLSTNSLYLSRGEKCKHPQDRVIAPHELFKKGKGRIMRYCHVCKRLIDFGPEPVRS